MLTLRQKQIKDFVDKTISRKGIAPTEREIAHRFRISPSTVHEHLATLQNKGYLEKTPGQARGIKISKSEKLISIPLLGTIAAGQPIEAVMNPESIAVPKSKIPSSSEVYALRVIGNSMVDDNINDGDTILVKKQNTAENKAIIYKIKNATGENLYTGIAGRARGRDRLLEHKELKREMIPGGTRFQYAQAKNKDRAEQIEKQIITKEQPEFNEQNK